MSKEKSIDRYKSSEVPLLVLMTLLSFEFPFLSLALTTFVFFIISWVKPWALSFGVIALVLLISLFNSSRLIEGDLIAYASLLEELKSTQLDSLLHFKYVTFDFSEPLYITYSYLFSMLNLEINYYIAFSTFVMYILFTSSQIGFVRYLNAKSELNNELVVRKSLVLVCFITALFSVNFVLTGHLIKQYLAMSFVAFALLNLIKNKNILAVGLCVIATLIHNSMVIFLFISLFLILFKIDRYENKRIILFFILALPVIEIVKVMFLNDYLSIFVGQDDGSIPVIMYVMDLVLALIFLLLIFVKAKYNSKPEIILFISAIIYVFVLMLVRDIPLLSLRLYFSFDIYRAFILSYLVYTYMSITSISIGAKTAINFIVSLFSITYLLFRITSTDLSYGVSGEELVLYDIFYFFM